MPIGKIGRAVQQELAAPGFLCENPKGYCIILCGCDNIKRNNSLL